MLSLFDVVIIGAGPAGMSAAIEVAKHGASVCILDEQQQAGGQIYRNVSDVDPALEHVLGKDYLSGRSLVADFSAATVEHRAGATVWNISDKGTVTYSQNNAAQQVHGRHIILAIGAIERPVPIPGWTLPGVVAAGAAQILMKSDGLAAKNAVLVGSGPLLYLVATQLLAVGAPPKALIETQTNQQFTAALAHLFRALKGWKQLAQGLRFLVTLKQGKVPRFKAATDIAIQGRECAEAVVFRANGKVHRIETDTVLLHQGVVPNTQVSRSLALDHRYNEIQRCFQPVTNEMGQSSHPLFSIAGDGAGIGGAKVAALSGRICALNALVNVGKMDEAVCTSILPDLLKSYRSQMSIRTFLDVLYTPPESVFLPEDDTIVCRCEEVRAGDIRQYAALGCAGPNRTKIYGRCGMGPCQGRYCGLSVTEILAAEHNKTQDTIGSFRIRAPLKPVTLSELAALSETIEHDATA